MSRLVTFAGNAARRTRRWVRRAPLVVTAWHAAVVERRTRSAPLRDRLQALEALPRVWSHLPFHAGDAVAVTHRCVPGTGAGQCLPRSLTLYGILVAMGEDRPVFCVGVHPDVRTRAGSVRSSIAHAWVEAGGQPLGEDGDVRATYRLLFEHSRTEPIATASARHATASFRHE